MGMPPSSWSGQCWREAKRQKSATEEHQLLDASYGSNLLQCDDYQSSTSAPAFSLPLRLGKENSYLSIMSQALAQQQQGTHNHSVLLKMLGNDKMLQMIRSSADPPQAATFVPQDQERSTAAREHLFYKVVTPSDVGKLNRLVIPKQHAERCFPLDPSMRKKGRLLSFEDATTREIWWFRYSYWSSSQSYVLTKGWIRFVKDKTLMAGDIISFERGTRGAFYINCRKRPSGGLMMKDNFADQHHQVSTSGMLHFHQFGHFSEGVKDDEDVAVCAEKNELSPMRLFGVDLRAKPQSLVLENSCFSQVN